MEEEDNPADADPKTIWDESKRFKKLTLVDDDLRDVAVLSSGYFGNKIDTDA